MTGHHAGLSGVRAYLAANAVGIAAGNVEELRGARCLPVGDSGFHHVAEVVELVREVFFLRPACAAGPVMRLVRVLRACGVEVAIGFLCRSDNVEHRVYIGLQLLVGIGLKNVRGTLDGLVGVGVVKRVADALHLEHLRGVFQVGGSILKVLVTAFALALRERQRDGDGARSFEALAPERFFCHLDLRERHGRNGIAGARGLLLLGSCGWQHHSCRQR